MSIRYALQTYNDRSAAIEPAPRTGALPLSLAQQRLWLLAQLSPTSPVYNEPIMVHIDELVDPAVMAACLTEIVRRHEAWRTVFRTVDGEPRQHALPPRPFHLDVADLRSQPAGEREEEIQRLAVEHASQPFDLRTGPVVRALLIAAGERESRLVVTAHHIAVDGVSFFGVFLPELSALLAALPEGRPSPLPEPRLHHADFAVWQRRRLDEEALAPQLAYWRERLAGAAELALPTDAPRPPALTGRGARVPIALPTTLAEALRALGRRAGVSLFATLLALWKTLLFRYTGQGDIVVGSAADGRPGPELDGVIGFFSQDLVLRTELDGAWSFLELLPRVGETLRGAREHQDVPFERLAELGAKLGAPIHDNAFLLMPPLPPLPGMQLRASRFDLGTAKVALYLELHRRPEGLVGHLEYQTERFAGQAIERMVGHIWTLAEGAVRDPSRRLAELPLLTPAEQARLAVWQGPAPVAAPAPEPAPASLEALFEAQAARSPDAIAVEHGERRLTYAELDARANRLAHELVAEGVGPETLVGLYLERSIEAMVAILAVLKAGGAYIPLDLSGPSERLRFVIEDAGIGIVLAGRARAGELAWYGGRVVIADEERAAPRAADRPASVATARSLAYVIYTSGSTGTPKGVMVERGGLCGLAQAQARLFGLGVGSRVLQFFSLCFDGSVWDLTMAWPVGATLVLADREALLPGPGLAHLLRARAIHAAILPPSALAATPAADLPELRVLVAGAEPLSEEVVARWAPGRRFFNAYGPTEATVAVTVGECRAGEGKPSVGRPLPHVPILLLDRALQPVPAGVPGELYIGGTGLARGYLNRPELTSERFVASPFPEAGPRLYRTGDRARWRPDGTIELLGRTDHQIKLRGFRIELEEIEAALARHPAVELAAVKLDESAGAPRLVGYFVARSGAPADLPRALGQHLREQLPAYMVPALLVPLERMPRGPGGKLDRAALPVPAPSGAPRPRAPGRGPLEQTVAAIWCEVLGASEIDPDASFFEVGGHSLALARVQARLRARLGVEVDLIALLRLPTIRQLAAHLQALPGLGAPPAPPAAVHAGAAPAAAPAPRTESATAIIGMAIRAPGIRGPDELWDVVLAGRETIRTFDPEALIAAGADPARVRRPGFVPAEGVLDDADRFDAGFFGVSDADAAVMDPQQRLFLECSYEALEHAGCDPQRGAHRIGVFGGSGPPLHWLGPVSEAVRASGSELDALRAHTLNAPDLLAPRVAFKLGLRGPAVTVQTACSTSLSAVHLARRSLLAGECDVALAGGITLTTLRDADRGYLAVQEGGPLSADGHCRPFDARASGTVRSSGAAIVVLKRLSDAVRDGDAIHAVILGSAMTNDGASKIGFTAPSEDGIAEAVQHAYESAGIDPRTVGFVEAHGTGTRLGDPIEVRALTRAYRRWTEDRGFCALGSVKANVGHVDTAAGATGLIKAALALEHGIIPPLAGFEAPNPMLDLPGTPFFVPAAPRPWPASGSPRRASVSSLGIGGTNVHVVLEEPPAPPPARAARPRHVLCLSAKTGAALSEVARRLERHLDRHLGASPAPEPAPELADVAFSLAGRPQHRHRAAIVGRDLPELRAALAATAATAARDSQPGAGAAPARPVAFLFPGHGAHYPRMGLEVYEVEPGFRAEVDRCFDLVQRSCGIDLRRTWLGEPAPREDLPAAQALLFTIEYALARQLLAWGLRPAALLGHSLGEYVAACVAGVLALPDALALVVERSRLVETTPPGAMIVALADARAVEPWLDPDVTVATYAPGSIVLAGVAGAVERARDRLARAGIETTGVRVAHAGHGPVMRGIRDELRRRVAAVELRPPTIPIIANTTGLPMTPAQATDPDAWADQLCSPVRLEDGLGALLDLGAPLCLEVGPGGPLSSALRRHPRFLAARAEALGTLPDRRRRESSAHESLLRGLGRAWEAGAEIDWTAFCAGEGRRRVPLPGYPFERRRFVLGGEARDLDARAAAIARELGVRGVDDVPGLRPRLTALCASLVLDFFARRLGGDLGRAGSQDELRARAGILPGHAAMVGYLVELLESEGLASRPAPGRVRLRAEHAGRSAELAARLPVEISDSAGLVRWVTHCVDGYEAVLCEGADPLGVVYPDGTNAFYLECTHHLGPPRWHVYASLLREVAAGIVAQHRGRTTRILEVAGGHGMLTWPLADRLRGADIEYHFTDIGRSFLRRADAEIERRGLSWMKTRRFDLDRPPGDQEIAGRYDLIVGLGPIHVSSDWHRTLASLHDLLVPGGTLIFVESTRTETWDQLLVGLLPGCWDIARRQGGLSADLDRWEGHVRGAGFSAVTSTPRDAPARASEGYGLVSGRRALADECAARIAPDECAPRVTLAEVPREDEPRADAGFLEELWRRLLGRSAASAEASFFDLGGDSLLAIQLLSELRLRTGRQITMRQFAADPTLRGLRALLPAEAPAAPPSPAGTDAETEAGTDAGIDAGIDAALDGAARDEDSVHAFLAQYLHPVRRRAADLPLDARIQLHDWHVIVLPGGRAAFAVGRVDSDPALAYHGARLSLVLVRQADAWRVVHSQVSLPTRTTRSP